MAILPLLQAAAGFTKEYTGAWAMLGAGIGAGLTLIGGGLGIGKLAAAAMEGIARQPNAVAEIRGAMIVAAGLIEGATFFALIVTVLLTNVK